MSWKQIITVGTCMVGGFLYLIYKSQEKILYLNEQIPPKRTSENPYPYKNPSQQLMSYEDVWLTTRDKLKLHAWYIPASSSLHGDSSKEYSYSYSKSIIDKSDNIDIVNDNIGTTTATSSETTMTDEYSVPTIVWFHANAGNMGFRLPNLYKMHQKLQCNLFILSYRGYGESEGEPNEEGIKIDAETAMEYLLNKSEIDQNKIFVFGRSLGGAVATYVASKYDSVLCGLILENTFLSISDMVGKVFPFLNFDIIKQFMLRIKWRTVDLIPTIKCPILFLASEKDEIVPHSHMIELHDSADDSSYKLWYKIKDGMHNDAWLDEKGGETYWKTMKTFIKKSIVVKEMQLRKEEIEKQNTNNDNNEKNDKSDKNINENRDNEDGIKSEL